MSTYNLVENPSKVLPKITHFKLKQLFCFIKALNRSKHWAARKIQSFWLKQHRLRRYNWPHKIRRIVFIQQQLRRFFQKRINKRVQLIKSTFYRQRAKQDTLSEYLSTQTKIELQSNLLVEYFATNDDYLSLKAAEDIYHRLRKQAS